MALADGIVGPGCELWRSKPARSHLTSVLCHLIFDMVKRVVTVKQASAAGGGWGLGMGMRRDAGTRGPGGAKSLRLAPENGSQRAGDGHRYRSPVSGLSSVLCHLSSARAQRAFGAERGRA